MLLSILCGAFVCDLTVRAEMREYQIDPEHLTIGFLVEHTGYAKVLGQFRVASGSYQFDEETGELSDVSIVVETGSVFTDHEQRDAHLRSQDFLDTRRFPMMTFSAVTARPQGNRTYELAGQLNLLGVTRPLTLTASWNKSGRYPMGLRPYVMGVSARGSFQRSAFGMTYAVENGWVGDAVEIIVEFEARRR
jgi:polyisoprenoid-binding protein YceI